MKIRSIDSVGYYTESVDKNNTQERHVEELIELGDDGLEDILE